MLLSGLVTMIPSRKWGRIAYGVVYYFYFIYTLVQFGVYLVLDRFVYVTDLFLAGEGADYASWVMEFAFNLGVYPYSNGNVSYALTRSAFPYSLASMFAAEGYASNSFHEGKPDFYNRGPMHTAFGYEIYHCYRDYPIVGTSVHDDTFLPKNDVLYEAMTAGDPFYSFVITYTAHLPYAQDDFTVWARAQFPEYQQYGEELSGLYAKARITDEMFRLLLERLEADGLLEDTVFVCFGDHYAYGLQDKELLQQKSEEAGSPILEKTPAFIWWPGCEGVEITKVCQTVDLAPTVMNLFGMKVPKNIMGSDILDDSYPGYAIFPYTTWVTGDCYVKYGEVQWNDGMTEEEIKDMNAFVSRYYYINDAILEADYYAED